MGRAMRDRKILAARLIPASKFGWRRVKEAKSCTSLTAQQSSSRAFNKHGGAALPIYVTGTGRQVRRSVPAQRTIKLAAVMAALPFPARCQGRGFVCVGKRRGRPKHPANKSPPGPGAEWTYKGGSVGARFSVARRSFSKAQSYYFRMTLARRRNTKDQVEGGLPS